MAKTTDSPATLPIAPAAPAGGIPIMVKQETKIEGVVYKPGVIVGYLVNGKPRPTPAAAAEGVTPGNLDGRLQCGDFVEAEPVYVEPARAPAKPDTAKSVSPDPQIKKTDESK